MSTNTVREIRLERSGALVALRARYASTLLARLVGLLGTSQLPPGSGLIIDPCTSVHMLFMSYAIDVLFCDYDGRVLRVCHGLKPWRFSPIVMAAKYAVELPAGTAREYEIVPGDRLVVRGL